MAAGVVAGHCATQQSVDRDDTWSARTGIIMITALTGIVLVSFLPSFLPCFLPLGSFASGLLCGLLCAP
jgi:hypothetical protein